MAGVSEVVTSTERGSKPENAHPRGGSGRDLSDPADLPQGQFGGIGTL